MLLSRHSVGTYQEMSSHATHQGTFPSQSSELDELLWTDPGLESKISVRKLISTKKKKKKHRREWTVQHYPQILTNEEKKPPQVCHLRK